MSKNKIRVLFVTTVYENIDNGPGKFANLIANNIDFRNIELFILTNDVSIESNKIIKLNLNKSLSKFGIFVRIYEISNKIAELNDIYNFEIIWYNNVIDGLLATYKMKNVKHIGMINDDNSAKISFKNELFSYKYFRHKLFHFGELLSFNCYDKIIVNSKYLKNTLEKEYRPKQPKIEILYKSIEIHNKIFHLKPLEISNAIKIVFVKSDFIRGGLLVLIKALNLLEYNFELVVIGPSPEILNKYNLKDKINKNIRLINFGKQNQSEVFTILKDCDIFCTPSLKEALGVSNMEALSFKIPVVYSNAGGINEVMNWGSNGFESNAGDVKSLAKAIENCILNKKERISKTENGYNFIVNNFNKERMFNEFEEICKRVINGK